MKKLLALVLALVMTLSLCVTSNAAYKDAADVDLNEAVDVMTAVGVFQGSDGKFDPKANLTREQAAKLVAYLQVGQKAADALVGGGKFADVAKDRWSAGYVDYCASIGIAAGVGGGLFDPTGSLTALQFGKMLLGCLGYDAKAEGMVGTDWTINTSKLMASADLLANLDAVTANSVITREQAAQMMLNALKAPMVEYTNKATSISVNGADVVFGGSTASYVTGKINSVNNIVVDRTNDTTKAGIIELGEKLFPKLVLDNEAEDDFGRPCRTWTYDKKKVGSFVKTELLVAEYTAKVTGKTLYDLLGSTALKNSTFALYIDGETEKAVLGNAYFTAGNLVKTNTNGVGGTGNGVLTQVFQDVDEDEITVVIINTYLAQADGDYSEKNDDLDLDVYKIDNKGTAGHAKYVKAADTENFTVKGDDFDIADVKDEDIFLVTVAAGEIQSMADPKVLAETEIDSFKKGSKLTIGGETYNFASTLMYDEKLVDYTDAAPIINLKDTTYNVYLDQYGYVVGIDEVTAADKYVFMVGFDSNYSNLSTKKADVAVIFTDGTMETVKVNVKKSSDELFNGLGNTTKNKAAATVNKWCTYTVDADDVYTLKVVGNYTGTAAGQYADTAYNKTIDKKHVTLKADTNKVAYGNANSTYIVVDTDEITVSTDKTAVIIDEVDSVATGVKNVNLKPKEADATSNNKIGTSGGVYTLFDKNAYVIAAIVVGENEAATKNYVYVTSDEVNVEAYDKTEKEYTWSRDVVVDGKVTTIEYKGDALDVIDTNSMKQGKWYEVKYYANGTVKSAGQIDFTTVNDKFVDKVVDVDDAVDDFDTVLLSDTTTATKLTFKGATLYTDVAQTAGFVVDEDVKVILGLTVDGDEFDTINDYEGVSGLEKAIKDLTSEAPFTAGTVEVNAVIENGVATVVILNDTKNTNTDEGTETVTTLPYKKVNLGTNGKVTLQDAAGTTVATENGTYEYVLYQRGPSQETFNVAADGELSFAGGVNNSLALKNGTSYYVIVAGVKSNTVTVPNN